MILTKTANNMIVLSSTEKEKILHSSDFEDFMSKSCRVMERALYAGTTFDINKDYLPKQEILPKEVGNLHLTKLFDEKFSKNRAITDLDWNAKVKKYVRMIF